ncbi:MAG: hypothetical protein K2W81_03095 [Sphingomonas sp.]|uniref:DUF6491 family protein n=1 Tax=Sphingomonas sp. TaxID=28214 RepID=UPI0025E1B245|nr:DUF6491 family protein [Sphingomonas sp.]MBY0282936.1 hypothetical protein [Sphingomonas sp.]
MARWFVALAATALAGGATVMAQDAAPLSPELAKALAGRVAGKPETCISASRVNGPEIIDSRNILYRQSGARIWRNEMADACPALGDNEILVVEAYGDQLCKFDRFRVVNRNSGFPSAYCILGSFTPYDKVKTAPKP